jgi:hypothetical protein
LVGFHRISYAKPQSDFWLAFIGFLMPSFNPIFGWLSSDFFAKPQSDFWDLTRLSRGGTTINSQKYFKINALFPIPYSLFPIPYSLFQY